MKLRLLPGLFLLRSLVRELSGIREQLTRQTDILARMAEQVAPQPPVVDRETVRAETGVDYVDQTDAFLVQQFVERTEHETGHRPDDDEILSYLSDEKTRDLHLRMIEREQVVERVGRERRR